MVSSYYRLSHLKRKAHFTLGFFFIFYLSVFGQTQLSIDSLESIYQSGRYAEHDKLKILKELAINHSNNDRRLFFSEELIREADALDSNSYLFQGFLEKGNSLRIKSDLSHALESYFQAAQLVSKETNSRQLGIVSIAIADVYAIMGNHQNAVIYHQNAIRILRVAKDSINIASALLNAGDEYINIGQLDSALIYTMEAESIFRNINYQLGEAYSLGNIGMIYAKLGSDLQAEKNMNKAIVLLQNLHEYYPIAVYLAYIADIYLVRKDYPTAINYAAKSLELAQLYGLKKQVSDAYLKLSEIYEQAGKPAEAFAHFKNYIIYKDSVNNLTSVQQMADLRTDFEVSRKQIEVDLLNQQKENQQIIVIAVVIAMVLILLLSFGIYRRYKFIRRTSQIILAEKNHSENLLLNILPKETAQELMESGKVRAKRFDSVTVLFTDFKGFTQYAEKLSPEKLVERVDFYFSKFDEIIHRHGLEKIKTIGDAYMCAGGLPFPIRDHAFKTVSAAIEIAEFVEEAKRLKSEDETFDIRIGINTGPVVAGIVGTRKFAYDIWGDTVNIASGMETNSDPGKINVSERTYELIRDAFDCEFRGEIEVKNKGLMKMYFVKNRRESNE